MDKVLAFIQEYIDENGYPPTYQDIADGCGISDWHVRERLDELESKVFITRKRGSPRSIRVIKEMQ